jgi:hypothetical protein
MSFLRGFGAFWYDFIIGDDWKIAAAVLVVIVVGAIAVVSGATSSPLLPPALGVLFAVAFVSAMAIDLRKRA